MCHSDALGRERPDKASNKGVVGDLAVVCYASLDCRAVADLHRVGTRFAILLTTVNGPKTLALLGATLTSRSIAMNRTTYRNGNR